MNELIAILILLLLVVLRFALPIGLTYAVCCLTNRWLDGCEAKADLATNV